MVGCVDLCADNIEERLSNFSKHPKFKGVRHIIQAEKNDFLLRDDFQNGISKLEKYNLVYDILIKKEQLENAVKLVKKFPKQTFVLNHMAKPNIKDAEIEEWKNDIFLLSEYENVFCKISGMITEANLKNWKYQDFKSYLDVVFNAFKNERLLFGSDWPVCLLAGKYKDVLSIVETYIAHFSEEEKQKIMGNNASKIYNL